MGRRMELTEMMDRDRFQAVQDYYAQAQPLTDRLEATWQAACTAHKQYEAARKAYNDWRAAHPVKTMVEKFDLLAMYTERSFGIGGDLE